jgi:putative tricarboxylic transport membrane protein
MAGVSEGERGGIILVFFTPVLAKWTLSFGFSELFWIAILGVTVIGSIGSNSLLMGLLSGALGLWLSTIGSDPILGVERFVFTSHLEAGIHIVPALIGLFAIPQILEMLLKKNVTTGEYKMEARSVLSSFLYNIKRIKALAIGGICGIVVGLIPGAGGQIAGLVSYDQVKKTSKKSQEFGKGKPDGVIAAESANNAMVGPSLVPLLTLSIPGSPTAAVLLGGLLIHGIFPGPNLFINHADVAWTFINSMIIGQILMLAFGLYISGLSRFVMKIKSNYMAPAITILAIFGAYSVQNNFSDVLIMMILGIAMFFMQKVGFSPAPLVLGLILGPIAENNFLQGKIVAETQSGLLNYFFTGPLNLSLIAICVVSILYSGYGEYKKVKTSS